MAVHKLLDNATTDGVGLSMTNGGTLAVYAFVNTLDIRGVSLMPDQPKFYDYRVNLLERKTNALKFYIGSEKGVVTAKCQFKVSFVLPNEDYGAGVPFPEYRSTKQGKQRVFVD